MTSDDPPAPREEPPAACRSALIRGVTVCRNADGTPRPYQHTPPHTGYGPSGSWVTWTDAEGSG